MGNLHHASWLASFLRDAAEEARRRGDESITADHIGLALTHPPSPAGGVLAALGVDPVDWRDGIVKVLGWREGASAERSGRPAGSMTDSPADLRFDGVMAVEASVTHILRLSEAEAAANKDEVAPVHLLVGLLLEGESVAAASGWWFGMSAGRVRTAAGLRNERRVVAEGAPPGLARVDAGPGAGPIVLCGGVSDRVMAEVIALARGEVVNAVLVDLGWGTRRPTAEYRRRCVERLEAAGARVVDSGLTDRDDANSAEACERLAAADLVWFAGGDAPAIYDRLWATPALDAILHAHRNGVVIGGVSAGAIVWGRGTLSDFGSLGEPEPLALFGLLESFVVFSHYAASRERRFRETVAAFPGCRGLAVAHGGAVLIPPGGGEPQVLREGISGAHVLLNGLGEPLRPVAG